MENLNQSLNQSLDQPLDQPPPPSTLDQSPPPSTPDQPTRSLTIPELDQLRKQQREKRTNRNDALYIEGLSVDLFN